MRQRSAVTLTRTPASQRDAAATAAMLAIFSMVMAAPNLPTPLLAVYRTRFGLSSFAVTVVFSAYLVALVVSLLGSDRITRGRQPHHVVAAAIGVVAIGNLMLATDSSAAVLVAGRVLTGLGIGLGTGAAALVLRAVGGPRATAANATCALAGSTVGTTVSALLVQYAPHPTGLVYLAHAAALAGLGAVVLAWPKLRTPPSEPTSMNGPVSHTHGPALVAAFAVGVAAWTTAGLGLALTPVLAAELIHIDNRVVSALPAILLLAMACLGQYAAGRHRARLELCAALTLMSAGLAAIAFAAALHSLPTLLLACAIAGLGQGLGFRTALTSAINLAHPQRHATATSRFAAIAYAGSVLNTLSLGALATAIGLAPAYRWLAGAFILASATTIGLILSRPDTPPTSRPAGSSDRESTTPVSPGLVPSRYTSDRAARASAIGAAARTAPDDVFLRHWRAARALTAGEWVPSILLTLWDEPLHYKEILAAVRTHEVGAWGWDRRPEKLHDSVLARTLRRMNDDGLIDRDESLGVFPPSVLYALTPPGRELLAAAAALAQWAEQHPDVVVGAAVRHRRDQNSTRSD
jgi:DNA-binding HxlR family transcriptional regulator/predicted MFS family arabinose efflux permease